MLLLGVDTRLESLPTFPTSLPTFQPYQGQAQSKKAAKPKAEAASKPKAEAASVFRSTKGASKQRRDLINAKITNLRDLLPFPESTRQRLSQLQIMSLSCVYIRKSNYFESLFGKPIGSFNAETPFEFAQSINGFLLTATRDGKLLYISENVTEYLGHSMVDMMTQGDSIYDIIDKRDHSVVQNHLLQSQFSATPGGVSEEKAFFCRMNVARSLRRQSGFGDHKVMHVRGHFVSPMRRDRYANQPVFTALCSPLVTPDMKDSATQNNTMVFRSVHGLDMKYIEMAKNGEHHLGYTDEEMKGRSWYELLHPDDISEATDKHMQLIKSSHEMGCMLTVRIMSSACEWVWVNMVMHIRQPFPGDNEEPAIVCINHVIPERDAAGFKLQSQLYSSHIARSPEIFSSPSGPTSPHHTITQVAGTSSSEQYPGGQMQGSQQLEMGAYGAAGMNTQPRTSTSSLSDSGSGSPDHKHHVHTDIINRLKRKMSASESASPCKASKLPRQGSSGSGSAPDQGSDAMGQFSYSGSIGMAPLTSGVPFLDTSDGVAFSAGPTADAPMYVQLQQPPQVGINPKDLLMMNLQQFPNSPLSPNTIFSDLSNGGEQYSDLSVYVNEDRTMVPASYLTPDCSPSSSPKLSTYTLMQEHQAHANAQPTLDDIASLQDVSKFEKSLFSSKPTSVRTILHDEAGKSNLPELDAPSVQHYLMDSDLNWSNHDEMAKLMEQIMAGDQQQQGSIKEEVADEEDLLSNIESFLDQPLPETASVTIVPSAPSSVSSILNVGGGSEAGGDLYDVNSPEQLFLDELSQYAGAANSGATPTYGDDLESTFFNSAL